MSPSFGSALQNEITHEILGARSHSLFSQCGWHGYVPHCVDDEGSFIRDDREDSKKKDKDNENEEENEAKSHEIRFATRRGLSSELARHCTYHTVVLSDPISAQPIAWKSQYQDENQESREEHAGKNKDIQIKETRHK